MLDTSSLFSLTGRVALVTGGSRGIGRMIAEGFIAQGARVYISARKSEQCEVTARSLGPNCRAIPADVATLAGVKALASSIQRIEPSIDILVNNAGAAWGAKFESFPEQGWDKVFDLNVKALFFLTQALRESLKRAASSARPSKVINIGSIDGLRISPWESYSYQASKAAVHHLTRRLAARLIHDNIVVSAIAPGAFPSEMNRAAQNNGAYLASIPSGRVGTIEDIAAAAIYLASRAGDYVVGETLIIDGGAVNANPPPMVDPE